MMERYLMLLQGITAGVIAWLSNKFGILLPMLWVLFFLMVIDYITGMTASKKESIDHPNDPAYGWNSARGAKGILKKVGYMAVIAVAMVLDYLIMVMAVQFGFSIPKSTFFALLTTAWYILNESLSIAENAGRLDADVPEWLLKYIAVLKNKIDDRGKGEE